MPEIMYIEGNEELLDLVEPLWEKLNRHHRKLSKHFAERYLKFTFELRKADLLSKVETGEIHICIAKDTVSGELIGYCISTVDKHKVGEIDSILVDTNYRGRGIGDTLIRKTLDWMDNMSVIKKKVDIAVGNEQAFTFYGRFGFFPSYITLQQLED